MVKYIGNNWEVVERNNRGMCTDLKDRKKKRKKERQK